LKDIPTRKKKNQLAYNQFKSIGKSGKKTFKRSVTLMFQRQSTQKKKETDILRADGARCKVKTKIETNLLKDVDGNKQW
jgi:hypothetical protein